MYEEEKFWWEDEDTVHNSVFSSVKTLLSDQKYRIDDNLDWFRSFTNTNAAGLEPYTYANKSGSRHDNVTLNIIHSMCTTVSSRIAKAEPKVTFLTSGGDWSGKRKAKLLDRFISGQFYASDIYEQAPKAFLDATIFGTGALKIYHDGEDMRTERVFPNEILVDDAEAYYGKPRQLFQRKVISKEVLIAAYPEFKSHILNASRREEQDTSYGLRNNQVECIEAWHLSSKNGEPDGRHCICLDNVTLVSEPYDKKYFPFVFIRWTEEVLGFWGQGLAEQLIGVQQELNEQLNRIKEQMRMATPVVFLNRGSKISKSHITNEVWNIIEHDGIEPRFHVPKTVSGEIFSHLDRLFMRVYEVAGVSQLAAQAKKPTGIDSGVALREISDIQSDRFILASKRYEKMFLSAAKQMINIARDMTKAGTPSEVISHGNDYIERISWADIDLKEDEYVLKPYPTALLSTTPAARLQTIQEMAQAGILTPEEALTLLDYPDMDRLNQLRTAPYDEIEMLIEEMLEHGRYHTPDPMSDLQFAVTHVQRAYTRAKIDKAPEDRLDLLARYIDDAIRVLQKPQEEEIAQQQAMTAPQAPPPEGVPEGVPEGMAQEAIPPELVEALQGMQ